MKPEFRPISVTIVDLMGVLLPGTIWLILFVTASELIWKCKLGTPNWDVTPISVAIELTEKNIAFYIMFLTFSFLIGYSIKLLVMSPAEWFTAFFAHPLKTFKKPNEFKDFLFPYHKDNKDKNFYKPLERIITEKFIWKKDNNDDDFISLPNQDSQPFSVSKRILKVLNQSLWEESEIREATVRMLSSLLIAAIFNLICAIVSALFINNIRANSFMWGIISLFAVIFLSIGFRKERKKEVHYTYLNLLVAKNFKSEQDSKSK